MDVVETVLYNGMLAGVSLDGTRFFYRNALRRERELPFHLRWSDARERFITSYCCPPNLLRAIAGSAAWAYGASPAGVWVNLYGSSELATMLPDAARVRLRQRTDYPWDGRVELTVEAAPSRPLAIQLRVPGWARGASILVNGKPADSTPVPGSYVSLERGWSPGDRVDLQLPVRPRLLVSHPLVEETRNQVAVARGPLVYCLESCDLPEGVSVSDVLLPSDITWAERRGDGVLAGMVLLEGKALRLEASGNSPDQLYRELPRGHRLRPQQVRLVPYFAWDNRGRGEMSVWLAVRWR
jgi:DUF1680 family protein